MHEQKGRFCGVLYGHRAHQSSGTLENVKHVKITSSSDAKPLYRLINNVLKLFLKEHSLFSLSNFKIYIFRLIYFLLLYDIIPQEYLEKLERKKRFFRKNFNAICCKYKVIREGDQQSKPHIEWMHLTMAFYLQ